MLSYDEYLKLYYPDFYELIHKNDEMHIDVIVKRFNDNCYLCPCCSSKLKLESKNECYGHGDYCLNLWLECECGIRTKSFAIYDVDSVRNFFAFIDKFIVTE